MDNTFGLRSLISFCFILPVGSLIGMTIKVSDGSSEFILLFHVLSILTGTVIILAPQLIRALDQFLYQRRLDRAKSQGDDPKVLPPMVSSKFEGGEVALYLFCAVLIGVNLKILLFSGHTFATGISQFMIELQEFLG